MGSGYYCDISAFLILICLIYAFFIQRLNKVEDNNIVFAAMFFEMLSSGMSIVYYMHPLNRYELTAAYYIASWVLTAIGIALLVLFLYFNRAYNIGAAKLTIFVGLPLALDIIFILLAAFGFSPVFRTLAYSCDVLLFTTGINMLYAYKKNSPLECTLMLFLMLLAAIAATITELVIPELVVQRFAMSLLFAETFFSLKNPEEQFDADTGLIGLESFRDEMRRRYYYMKRHGGETSMALLMIHGSESFMRLLGEVNELKLRQSVISEIKRIANGASVYRLKQGAYAFLTEKGGREEIESIHEALIRRFESTFGNDAYEMELPYSTCRIDLPEMASDGIALMDLIHVAIKEGKLYGKSVVDLKSLDLSTEEYMRQVDEKVRHAVEDGNLEVYYQPIYSLKEKRFVSAEALLRLHDGDKFIPPDVFITVAENNGSIVEIDDYVIKQVCSMISGRNIGELGLRYIELNLSVSDMLQDDIAGKLTKFADMYHIHPSQINLEITETSDDTFTGVVEANVMKLSQLGFNFSLDDFGTGYSSLSRIIMMPFDIIKLDKTIVQSPFVMDTEQERRNAMTLLESSADMIQKIGAETVAEGVETAEQLKEMERLGVDFIQGYYFARPMPESDFINAVRAMNKR
ncbi:MAG: EAL domain-containing protein [Lachnospiraceae bacterium]|nr:EAL domain-containing protein [Lachnospiraceae bacterium]